MAAKTRTAKYDKTYSTYVGRLQHLLQSGMFGDIVLIIGEKKERVKSHKLILMTGSPYFKTKFLADTSIKEISFPFVKFEVFWRFLKFLYSGETDQDVCSAIPLLNLAAFFRVSDLEEICFHLVQQNLTKDNSAHILQQALEYCVTDVIDAASKIICRHAAEIVESPDFLELTTECLTELLKRDVFAIETETQLFEAINRWAAEECKRQGTIITPKYCRSALDPLIPYIRFPLIDPAYFSLKVAPRNILTTEEMVSVLLDYNTPIDQRAESPPGLFNAVPRQYLLSTGANTEK